VGVNIALTGVNPYFLAPKWYEKIGITSAAGFGSTKDGAGLLLGLGASYKFGKWELGPSLWWNVGSGINRYYGLNTVWHPFEQSR